MNKIRFVDSFILKIIAMITMVIDHVGCFILPQYRILRYIGRISFVLFAFQTVESMSYSKHKERYIGVLLLFELVMSFGQMIFTHTYHSTIFIVLALGAITIYFLQKQKWYLKPISLIPVGLVIFANSEYTQYTIDYTVYGYLVIVGYYLCREGCNLYFKVLNNESIKEKYFYILYSLVASSYMIALTIVCYMYSYELALLFAKTGDIYTTQIYACYAGIILMLYNGKKGYSSKPFRYFCYLFYPIHIAIIYLIAMCLY